MSPTLNMNGMSKYITLTVRVKGQRIFWARWWLARQLLQLSAFVAGCNIKIDVDTGSPTRLTKTDYTQAFEDANALDDAQE